MSKVFIVAAKRTAVGKFMGSLSSVSPADMAAEVIKNIINETKINPASIDEVIVGNILMAGYKQGIARQAAVKAGIPVEVPAYGINMICGSGMKAILDGATHIKAGEAEVVLAGGTESMSNAGYVLPGTLRNGNKMGDFKAIDHMVCDGLTDAFEGYHMGITAENVAEKYGITRKEQDEFSYNSQVKAATAIDEGRFKNEIVPITVKIGKEMVSFDTDEFVNRSTNPDKLANLKPAFKKDGTVTAGNASGINDGAAAVMMMSAEKAKELGLKPLAKIVAYASAGVEPEIMGMGPVPAVKKTLEKAGWTLDQVDLIEANEAFAAQALGVAGELKFDMSKVNVNGGAIALGHPIGASGTRILVTLLHEMQRRDAKKGLATLCIGGGMGVALPVER